MILLTSASKYVSRQLVLQLKTAGAWRSIFNHGKVFKLLIAGMAALGVSSLIPQVAHAQNAPASGSVQSVGNNLNYPVGTRIYQNGAISTPDGSVIYPSSTVDNGNSTTYYYQDGTRVTTRATNPISPSGTFLTPGLNGGVSTGTNGTFSTPRVNGGFQTIPNGAYYPNPGVNGGIPTIPNGAYYPNPGVNRGIPTIPNGAYYPNPGVNRGIPTIPNGTYYPNDGLNRGIPTIPNGEYITPGVNRGLRNP